MDLSQVAFALTKVANPTRPGPSPGSHLHLRALGWDDDRVRPSGLERRILEEAALGHVLENVQESAPAVGAVYHRLDTDGLLCAEWFGDDEMPLQVELTPAGRMLLRSRP